MISCKKDFNSQQTVSSKEYNNKLKANIKDLGASHNSGISYSINSNTISTSILFPPKNNSGSLLPTPNYASQDIKNIIISTYDFIGSTYGEEYRGIPSQILQTVVDVINSENTLFINSKIDATEELLTQNNLLSSRESLMIQELQDIFAVGSQLNMTSEQAGPYFANKLKELRTKYKNIVWNINEGEGFLGMLSIAESSNEYWHLNTTVQSPSAKVVAKSKMNITAIPTLAPFDLENSIVHVDLAGYALAWGWAVYNDWAAGNLHESGQYGRITKGLQGAITASTMRLIKTQTRKITVDLFPDSSSTSNPLFPGNGGNGGGTGVVLPKLPGMDLDDFRYADNIDRMKTIINGKKTYFACTTKIFFNNQNGKYYSDSTLQTVLPDGFYTNDLKEVYKIVNGEYGGKQTILPCSNCSAQEVSLNFGCPFNAPIIG